MSTESSSAVTFVSAKVEGSTRLWERHPEEMQAVSIRHHELVRAAVTDRNGHVFTAAGDEFAAAFDSASDAVRSAVEAQRTLRTETWPGEVRPDVRIGVASGEADMRAGGYVGLAPRRAARIMAAAHGGQILVDAEVASILDDAELLDLGEHRLEGPAGTEHLFQVVGEGLEKSFPPLRTPEARRGNLPALPAGLVGRDQLMAEIADLTIAHPLVTLSGVGGVGKTRLALEVAAELSDGFPDGVWFVELAPVGVATAVPDAIATTVGIAPQGETPLIDTVADALSGRRALLVIDNCEHVLDGVAAAVKTILAASGTIRVLATSRESLFVAGEQRVSVPPLKLEGGTTSPAVTLFVERARAARPGFQLDEAGTAEAVTEICRTLDGLALGIELAAARMVSMTAVDVRDRLGDRFRLLSGPARGPVRLQTLRHAVGWSYDLLNDDERDVLRHAAVFSGGFELAAIAEIAGAVDELRVLEVLDSLVRKSLVTVDLSGSHARYGLLETIRQFTEEELTTAGTLAQVRDRHAAYYAREAVARWEVWNGPRWRDSVDWVEVEVANLRAAFRWSAERADMETAVDVAAHAALMGVTVELFEAVTWAEELLAAATEADVCRLPRLYTAAGYACFTGRPEQAASHAHTATELEADPRYDPCEPGLAMFVEALAQVYSGHLDRYVELSGRVAELPGSARAYGMPAHLDGLQASGRVDDALEIADAALAAAREVGNPFWIAYSFWTYGSALAKADPALALSAWTEGLAYVKEHGVRFFEGFIGRDAARLHSADTDPGEALTLFDSAIESFDRAGNVAQLTITLASANSLFERIDRLESAATLYGAISCQPGSLHHVPDLPSLADRLASKLGDEKFGTYASSGAALDLHETARYARQQIQLARSELSKHGDDRPGGLSGREVEVLRLVADGLTTREIGERLFISPKTADHHIQHIYTKIDVSSRAAAARWAVEQGVVTDAP